MKKKRKPLALRKRVLFSVIAVLAFFLFLELGLALIGVKTSSEVKDPYLGFSGQAPLFAESADGQWKTAANKLAWFNPQRFAMPKPEGVTRVFTLGGSTTYGRPYEDPASFSGWLREMLPDGWEVINAGGISYASYRVALVAEELLQYEPDIFVVYCGHNEFLEARTYGERADLPLRGALAHSHLYSLMEQLLRPPPATTLDGEVQTRLDQSVGPQDYVRDDEQHAQIVAHYRYNLARIIGIAESAKVKIVLVTPASNLADCSPFKADSNLYSNAQKRLAEGDLAEAHSAFVSARDQDICPLRAPTPIIQAVRDICELRKVPLVDFEARVAEIAKDGIPGADLFVDHVHLHVDGYGELAKSILPALGVEVPGESEMASIREAVMGRIDPAAEGRAFRNLAKVMSWAGKFAEAQAPSARAVELLPNDADAQYHHGVILGKLGNHVEALAAYQRCVALAPNTLLAHNNMGNELEALGRGEEAVAAYQNAVALDPTFALGHKNLGVLLGKLRRLPEALAAFQLARSHAPKDAEISFNIGILHIVNKEWELAASAFRETLAKDANFAAAKKRLDDLRMRGYTK